MRRRTLCVAALIWALCAGATAWAVTRINGNQLLAGATDYGFGSVAAREAADVARPRLVVSVGQGVMAYGEHPHDVGGPHLSDAIGAGLGYDIAHYIICPVGITGDLTGDENITASDLIRLVQFIFTGAPPPDPCAAIGDVNCSGNLTASDLTTLVNYIFKGGKPPCNVCSMIPDSWPCY